MYAVLFDIDGTLIQTGGAGQLAFAEAFAKEFGVAELPGDVSFAGRSDRAIAEDIMRHHGLAPSDENWDRFSTGYCQRLLDSLSRREGHVLAGVVELLDDLERLDGVIIGLLTGNVAAGADVKLGHYAIRDRFAFGGFGDRRTDRNDIAADAVEAAKLHAGGPLCGVMVIGDTANDVRCGRSVGAFTVAVATGGASREELADASPDLLLDDLTDTKRLLAKVNRPNGGLRQTRTSI